jgi:hypothetical protein
MKAILALLALLAVATTASATYAPWYQKTLFKWKCYVPGCDQVRTRIEMRCRSELLPRSLRAVTAVTPLAAAMRQGYATAFA